jgi:hypothetical protein
MYKSFIVLTAALGMMLTACGNPYGDLCASSIQCEGGNDKDVGACIALANGAEEEAAAYGCSDAHAKLIDCVNRSSTCNKTHFQTSCNAESDALAACENAASGRK